jgi:hypothetical protein
MNGIQAAFAFTDFISDKFVSEYLTRDIAELIINSDYPFLHLVVRIYNISFISQTKLRDKILNSKRTDELYFMPYELMVNTKLLFRRYGEFIPSSMLNTTRFDRYKHDIKISQQYLLAASNFINIKIESRFLRYDDIELLLKNEVADDYKIFDVAILIADVNARRNYAYCVERICELLSETRPLLYLINKISRGYIRSTYKKIFDFAAKYHISLYVLFSQSSAASYPHSRCFHAANIKLCNISNFRCNADNCSLYALIKKYIPQMSDIERADLLELVRDKYPQFLDHFGDTLYNYTITIPTNITSVTPAYYHNFEIQTSRSDRIALMEKYGRTPDVIYNLYDEKFHQQNIVQILMGEVYGCNLYSSNLLNNYRMMLETIINQYPRFILYKHILNQLLDRKCQPILARLLFKYPHYLCVIFKYLDKIKINIDSLTDFVNRYNVYYSRCISCALMSLKIGATKLFGEDIAEIIIAEYKLRRGLV